MRNKCRVSKEKDPSLRRRPARSAAERQTICAEFSYESVVPVGFFSIFRCPIAGMVTAFRLCTSAKSPGVPIDVMLKTKAKVQFDREVTERDVTVPHFEPLSIRRNLSSFCKFANLEVDDFRFINDFG
jgi:hypothetical protein